MPKINKIENENLQEFQFSIEIDSTENNSFYYIRQKVSKELFDEKIRLYSNLEMENIPYLIIKSKFDRHFKFLGSEKAYLCNYVEREGSLIIDFTILILNTAIGYGSIRSTIDYFADDLKSLFKGTLSREFKIDFTHDAIREIPLQENSNLRDFAMEGIHQIHKSIFVNRLLIGIILFLLIAISTYFINKENNDNSLDKNDIESILNKTNNNPFDKAKIEVIIRNSKNDSVQ